jgi:hypothetical protein
MCQKASELAGRFPYHRLLGFDLCVTSEGRLRLLEVNVKNLEINFFQMSLGPLFGPHTQEVIDYCRSSKRSVVLDFAL